MNKKVWIGITALVWVIWLFTAHRRCDDAWFQFAIDVDRCPDGNVRMAAELDADGLRRGVPGSLSLHVDALYTTARADDVQRASVEDVTPGTSWLVGKGKPALVLPVGVTWGDSEVYVDGRAVLPVVPDGDYELHVHYTSPLGPGEVSLPLALYAPARIHVLTDRPLYQPGDPVKFRAVVLRASDLTPLDGRPGTWTVRDPDNEVVLEEKAPAGAWGVIAGSFPLDRAATPGIWRVAWSSADASTEATFEVKPFTLPRYRVEASADRTFYQAGQSPVIRGSVVYSSGAPVAGAELALTWTASGAWQPPGDWLAKLLPARATAGANGRFELALPRVPDDLQGIAGLHVELHANDGTGDLVDGGADVMLSQDAIQASAVTELGDGLVASFNNRLYVRVTRPDGEIVRNTKVWVRRAWQPAEPPIEAELDEDGVASLQLDPGAPVNIVIPAQPYRPAQRPALVSLDEANELIGNQQASLADRAELERWLARFEPCAIFVPGDSASVRVGARIAGNGSVLAAIGDRTALDRCVAGVIKQQHLPAAGERLYTLQLTLRDPGLPMVAPVVVATSEAPAGLDDALGEQLRLARDCVPAQPLTTPPVLTWRAHAGSKDVELSWLAAAHQAPMPACVPARLAQARIVLDEPATSDVMGVMMVQVRVADSEQAHRPQPTTMVGYELAISAPALADKPATKLRVAPGNVPGLRMRVTPVIAKPGDTITAQLFRGPRFTGKLPEKLTLTCLRQSTDGKLDPEHRTTIELAATTEGWCRVTGGDVSALVYVQPQAQLSLTVTPGKPSYAPGDTARLAIETKLGDHGGPAAVALSGVDSSLGQLVALPGPDALAKLQPEVGTDTPAFGALDGQALALGRIRGANAAAATVLRVSKIPAPPELDAVAKGHARTEFDPIAELTDRFYIVLAELHTQVQAWEAKRPATDKMTPLELAKLWQLALEACAARGARVDDAFGRRLELRRLPPDLLELTDPRAVVVNATRLPEDVENWPAWVARQKP